MESKLCKQIEPQLDAFHDGELLPDEQEAVSNHLAGCSQCVSKLAEIDRVVHSLRTMPRLQVSSRLSERLDSIAGQELPKSGTTLAFKPRFLAPIAAAAAVLAIVFGWHIMGSQPQVATLPAGTGSTTVSQLPVNPPLGSGSITQPIAAEHNQSTQPMVAAHEAKSAPIIASTGEAKHAAHPVTAESQPEQPSVAALPTTQTNAESSTQPAAPASEEELAEVPATHSSFNEALGISTDEDGLYDIKM